jgi:hypothetical protein
MDEYLRKKLVELCLDGLCTDRGHHKQSYLEEILKLLKPTAEELWNISWEEGIPG